MAKLADKVKIFLEMFGQPGEEVLEKAAKNEKTADAIGLTSKEHDEEVTTTETLKDGEQTEEKVGEDGLTEDEAVFAEALTEAIDERLLEVVPLIVEELGKTELKERNEIAARLEALENANTTLKEQNRVMADALKELLGETPKGLKKFVASQSDSTKTGKTTTKAAPEVSAYDSFQDEFIGNFFMRPAQLNGRQE